MKTNIIKMLKDIQSGSVPEEKSFYQIMEDLSSIQQECVSNNKFTSFPDASEYLDLYSTISEFPFFKDKLSLPTVWGDFIASSMKKINYLKKVSPDYDPQDMLSDISSFDGFQEYNKQKTTKKETSTVGLGSFDAMFVGFQNEVVQKENEKEKDFSINKKPNGSYARFKAGDIKEESFFNLETGIVFSSLSLLDYTRFNCFLFLDNEVVQIVASSNEQSKKQQIHIYSLDLNGNINSDSKYSVAQFIRYDSESAFCKLIAFQNEYIKDFNSFVFSYADNCPVFKGITTILKPYNKVSFFKEYDTKGFEFSLVKNYEKHLKTSENKLKEDLDFKMKKLGRKENGDIANTLSTVIRQSNVLLLEDFTDLERDRLLLNIKPTIKMQDFDFMDFSTDFDLDDLLGFNKNKMKALDAIDVYSSNIHPAFGRAIIDSNKFFYVAEQDVEVPDFVYFKNSVINIEDTVKPVYSEQPDLRDFVFFVKDIVSIENKIEEKNILGQIFLKHKDNLEHEYPNCFIPKKQLELLKKEFNLTDFQGNSFIFDQRRDYINYVKTFLKDSGACEINSDDVNMGEDINISIDNICVFTEKPEFYQEVDDETVSAVLVRFSDERFFSVNKELEQFYNKNVNILVRNLIDEEKEDLFLSITESTEPNSGIFVYKKSKESDVKQFFSKFKQKTLPKKNKKGVELCQN